MKISYLLETYWERMQLQYPIYFSLGLTEKVYKFFYFNYLINYLKNEALIQG